MTEITRVPLQPIARGALSKLWIGLVVLMLAAAGVAYAALPPAIRFETIKAGTGPSPTLDDVTVVGYRGTLPDGRVFDENPQTLMPVAGNIPGFTKALQRMQRGGKYHVVIPAALAYGEKGGGPIPPNTDLAFDVTLLDFVSREEFERQRQALMQLQQMQAAQGRSGAAPVGPVGAAPIAPAPGGPAPGGPALAPDGDVPPPPPAR